MLVFSVLYRVYRFVKMIGVKVMINNPLEFIHIKKICFKLVEHILKFPKYLLQIPVFLKIIPFLIHPGINLISQQKY